MKQIIKQAVFSGLTRDSVIRGGLLRGLRFHLERDNVVQRVLGLSEREVATTIQKYSSLAKTALDIGANDGWYSVYFACQPNIEKVIACEPDSACHECLHRNLMLNSAEAAGKVSLEPSFVGSVAGQDRVTVDELLMDCTPPYLLKVDVEGDELSVLHGAQKALVQNPAYLIVETHSSTLERDCMAYLEGLGYDCSIIYNAWYRFLIPERRIVSPNRWVHAWRRDSDIGRRGYTR